MNSADFAGGLKPEDDFTFAEPPAFEWLREGTSVWIFDSQGRFAIPRIGVEMEPHVWDRRRYASSFTTADGRVIRDAGVGAMVSPFDDRGRPAIMAAGPLSFRCIEPFRRWHVSYDGSGIDTTVQDQIANTIDDSRCVPLRYEVELEMNVPAMVQDVSPAAFFRMPKGQRRDALSVGLGWRLEQLFTASGEIWVDGGSMTFEGSGNRVKRRSVRTDGLFLRGHAWQAAVFPAGRAFYAMNYPQHDDGEAGWDEAHLYVDGRMIPAKLKTPNFLRRIVPSDDDVSLEFESELGTTRILGRTRLSTFRIGNKDIWGLDLQQSGALYSWDGQETYGMIERSSPSKLTTIG